MFHRIRKGFTLIELLIVVAIIGILAAIAIPNFLEAQVRAKVANVKADLRNFALAEEMYYVDNDAYSPDINIPRIENFRLLTTPIAYLTSIPRDPFRAGEDPITEFLYEYMNKYSMSVVFYPVPESGNSGPVQVGGESVGYEHFDIGWFIYSFGPDLFDSGLGWMQPDDWHYRIYDPTNGSVSFGDIGRCSKGQVPAN